MNTMRNMSTSRARTLPLYRLVLQSSLLIHPSLRTQSTGHFSCRSRELIHYWWLSALTKQDLQMEIDTGASVSVISEDTYLSVWPGDQRPVLQKSTAQLRTYSGELMHVCGTITVCVFYRQQQKTLPLLVVRGAGRPLFGRDWMKEIKLDWKLLQSLHSVNKVDDQLQSLLENHAEVFRDELGSLRDIKVTLQISPDAQPCYHRPRPIPYMLYAQEWRMSWLDWRRMEWSNLLLTRTGLAPIVPVVKRDGAIRICGDFKVTVNKVAKRDMYPLPKVEDLLSTLAGGKSFSKLYLSHAYQQLHLSEESKPLVTIQHFQGSLSIHSITIWRLCSTIHFPAHNGEFAERNPQCCDLSRRYPSDGERLMLSTSRIYSKCYRDCKSQECDWKDLNASFMLPKVTYLGYVISSEGVHPAPEKVRAIRNAPIPTNLSQLKSFLSLLNFYSRFLPNQSTLLAPLHRLLRKNTRWEWGSEQQTAFEAAKSSLSSSSVLIHFNPDLPLIVSADASSYGVGAVLTHQLKDGTEQPVAFSSRTLSPAEKNYAQIDKEGLAIIFAVTKFRQYLLGRSFGTEDWSQATDWTVCTWSSNLTDVFSSYSAMESDSQQFWLHHSVQEGLWECRSWYFKSFAFAWISYWCAPSRWNSASTSVSPAITYHCYSDQALDWQRSSSASG